MVLNQFQIHLPLGIIPGKISNSWRLLGEPQVRNWLWYKCLVTWGTYFHKRAVWSKGWYWSNALTKFGLNRTWIHTWQVLFLSCSFPCTLSLLTSSLSIRSSSVFPSSDQKDFLTYRYDLICVDILTGSDSLKWVLGQVSILLENCSSLWCNEKAWGLQSHCFIK